MNRYYILSMLLHGALFLFLFIVGQNTYAKIPQFDVYKVSIAPLPQPKIIEVEEPAKEEIKEEVKKEIQKEKAPPPKEKPAPKKPTKQEKKVEKVVKKGLPDISPKVYTGSGRGFTYSYYLNILLNKINKNWHNPFKGKDIVLKSIVYFEVDTDGRIYNVRLEENSGDELYNETTIRAVVATKRLPPLPQEFADDYLKVHLEFLTAQ